jgi:hypothetical protein
MPFSQPQFKDDPSAAGSGVTGFDTTTLDTSILRFTRKQIALVDEIPHDGTISGSIYTSFMSAMFISQILRTLEPPDLTRKRISLRRNRE